MNNQQILDQFGELFIKKARDSVIHIMQAEAKRGEYGYFTKLPSTLQESIKNFSTFSIDTALHYFLWMIEQHEEFDLVYRGENKETLVSLRDISEMLCAEPTGQGGWIERFSKYPPSVR